MLTNSNCLVAQSGGPTTVINASLAGIISQAISSNKINTIYGSLNGIEGVLDDRLINLSEQFETSSDSLELLKYTPSMFLGSCRYKLPSPVEGANDYSNIFSILKKYNIGYFFYIGGNDSMDTVSKLSKHAKLIGFPISIIGIPKTIDNDLTCTDHTPGYGSAAKYIASSILEISHDAYIYNKSSVTIIEIMGRNAGWLTAAAALARNEYSKAPHLIYLPEVPFSVGQFVLDVKEQLSKRKHVIIAVSEGIKDNQGEYISAKSEKTDQFGHYALNGTGKYLESIISDTVSCKVRSIELNVLQRCSAHISSLTDINEAFSLGEHGVNIATSGKTGEMATISRVSTSPYEVEYKSVCVDKVANLEKVIDSSWISTNGHDIENEFLEYISPLILGEPTIKYTNGIPNYLSVKHLYS